LAFDAYVHCQHTEESIFMSQKHRYLPIARISAGMVLADELLDKMGHVLLPAGTQLTQNMINSMEHHDVHQLSIVIEETEEEKQEELAERQRKRDRLAIVFRHGPYQAPTSTLMSLIAKFREEPTS